MLELYTLSCHYLEWQTPSYLENEIVHFHNFLGKKGTFHLKFKMEKRLILPKCEIGRFFGRVLLFVFLFKTFYSCLGIYL